MRALVVYESMYGNTRTIAEAVAEGLATTMAVDLVAVESAPTELPPDLDLLVVGGPTHAFGLSRASTRDTVVKEVGRTATDPDRGLREWLDELRRPEHRPMVATFSTRVRRPRVPGSAARKAEKRLRHLHLDVVRAATDFWVVASAGPLADGETTRALHWGEGLAAERAWPGGPQPPDRPGPWAGPAGQRRRPRPGDGHPDRRPTVRARAARPRHGASGPLPDG